MTETFAHEWETGDWNHVAGCNQTDEWWLHVEVEETRHGRFATLEAPDHRCRYLEPADLRRLSEMLAASADKLEAGQ